MDIKRFDQVARTLGDRGTRRRLLGRLAALPLAATLGTLLGEESEAGRRRRHKARHRPGKRKDNRKGKRKGKDKGNQYPCNGCPPGKVCNKTVCEPCDVCASGCAFTTVQAAIDAANSGAIIRICEGNYAENIVCDKDLLLLGARSAGPFPTTLQGASGNESSVVHIMPFRSVELRALRVSGGHSAAGGGGVFNDLQGILEINECNITGNSGGKGGGVANRSQLTIRDSIISDNEASAHGGGIFSDGDLILNNTRVEDNQAGDSGGGIANRVWIDGNENLFNGHVHLIDGAVLRNEIGSGGHGGGGIYNAKGGSVTIDPQTVVDDNRSDGAGGAIFNGGTVTFTHGRVENNFARVEGGGIFNDKGTITLTQVSVTGNQTSEGQAGGIFTQEGTVTLSGTQNMVTGNTPHNCSGDPVIGCSG